jgi:hypothetical protein
VTGVSTSAAVATSRGAFANEGCRNDHARSNGAHGNAELGRGGVARQPGVRRGVLAVEGCGRLAEINSGSFGLGFEAFGAEVDHHHVR